MFVLRKQDFMANIALLHCVSKPYQANFIDCMKIYNMFAMHAGGCHRDEDVATSVGSYFKLNLICHHIVLNCQTLKAN